MNNTVAVGNSYFISRCHIRSLFS